MLTTAKRVFGGRLTGAAVIAAAMAVGASHVKADGGTGRSFTTLAIGFTQDLFGISPELQDPEFGILGGVAFAPDGDVWSSECVFLGTRLHRFDRDTSGLQHGSSVHPETIVDLSPTANDPSVPEGGAGGCGLVNHPNGIMYSLSSAGVWALDADTGLPLGTSAEGPGGNALGIAVDPLADAQGEHHLVYVGADCHPNLNLDPEHPTTTCTLWDLNPTTHAVGVFARLSRTELEFLDGIYFDPSGQYLFTAHRAGTIESDGSVTKHNGLRILHRPATLGGMDAVVNDMAIVRDVAMPSEPDGVAFHAQQGFVITLNESGDCRTPGGLISPGLFTTDDLGNPLGYCADAGDTTAGGTITKFDFPDGNYSAAPVQSEFASGGFRGDLLQVGADGCVYASQGKLFESRGISGARFDDETPDPADSIVKICGGFAVPPGVSASGDGVIGDYVWNDENQNGAQDSGEPGLDGVTMTLTGDALEDPLTTTTHDGGQYTFTALKAGTYHVTAALPPELDLVPTISGAGDAEHDSNSNPAEVTLADNTSQDLTVDFGFHTRPASLTGFAYVDANRNHTMDEDEDIIPFVPMSLGGAASDTQATDLGGSYLFTDLVPGAYTVSAPSTADGKALDTPSPLPQTLAANQHATGLNFGYVPGRLSGFAYADQNRNGSKDGGEPGIGGVAITLGTSSAVTAVDGSYTFDDLDAGTHVVAAPVSAEGKHSSTTNPLSVHLDAGEDHPNVNFGYVPGSIAGFAYVDANRNNVKDGGEAVLSSVLISLAGGGTTTTAGDGSYSFNNLDEGTHSVSAPASASGKALFTTSPLSVNLGAGEARTDVNFGYVPGSIAGFAYVDANNNGVKDGSESGIPGVSIVLDGTGATVFATSAATTAADGSYSFAGLDAGTYSDAAPSSAVGKSRSTASPLAVTLVPGQSQTNVNFGYVPGGLSGFAYFDVNHNSSKDSGEAGLGGVTITLAGGGTRVTAGDGSYAFSSLDAGPYSVAAPASAGPNTLFTASPLAVTLAAGQTQPNVNFGYVSPNPNATLTKTANPTTYNAPGQVIVYTYVMQNTGDVPLSGPFTVADDKLGSFQCGTATLLAPGASLSCTKSYTIQASDLGSAPNLPTGVVANVNTGAWLQGVMSTQDTTIGGVGTGLPDGVYPGWCIQDHVIVDLHNQPGTLYSTIGGNLPADVASLAWGKVNYVLNHKIRGAGKSDLAFFKDVQTAVWVMVGELNPEFGISASAQQMIDAANAHPDFVPGYGDVVAVIIYSDGMGTNPNTIQESIIEVKPYQSITNHATATGMAGSVTLQTTQVQATVTQAAPPAPPPVPTAPMDAVAWGHKPSAATTVTTSAFSTTAGGELLLAFVSADAPSSGTNTTVTGVSGAGLTWQLVKRTNVQRGTAEIWRAFAPTMLSNASVTATLSQSVASSLTVVSLTGVDTSGTNGSGAIGATVSNNGSSGAPTISLTTTRPNSWVFGVGTDWDNPIARTVGANQAMVHQYMPPVGDTYWVQRVINAIPSSGTVATLNDTAPTTDRWDFAAVEVLQPGAPPPMVTVPDVVNMTQSSASNTISSASLTPGAVSNASSATVPSGSVISQSPAAGAQVATGSAVALVVSSGSSAAAPTVDKVVFSDGNGTRTTSAFSTTSGNELLLAFVATDGPTSGGQTGTVSGAGITWTLVKRANTRLGSSEIWKATAAGQLSNVTVSSTQTKTTYHQSLTVVAFKGASGVGASATGGAASGAPTASLTTTKANSLVYGVGNDWDTATARTVGSNQTMVHQWVDTGVGDTFWVQSRSAAVAGAGTFVPINDSAPTGDQWNLAIVEIVP